MGAAPEALTVVATFLGIAWRRQWAARRAALARLREVVSADEGGCMATAAITQVRPARTVLGLPPLQARDERLCVWCDAVDRQKDMILCDHCNPCYHAECARSAGGSPLHDGPWFCKSCKGYLVLAGIPDATLDWPLHAYLWLSALPDNPDASELILCLAEDYRARGNELQVFLPATATREERWVDVPPLLSRPQLPTDTHVTLAHCGWEKMLAALREYYWWPAMHTDVMD